MATTTAALSGAYGKIEIQTGGVGAFVDISGSAQSVDTTTAKRMYGKAYPLDSDTPKNTYGKQEGSEMTVNVIYTEVVSEGYQVALTSFETAGGGLVAIRLTPGGSVASSDTYTTAIGRIISVDYPGFDGSKGDPIMCSFTLAVEVITHALS
jgi:hypothetical protein